MCCCMLSSVILSDVQQSCARSVFKCISENKPCFALRTVLNLFFWVPDSTILRARSANVRMTLIC